MLQAVKDAYTNELIKLQAKSSPDTLNGHHDEEAEDMTEEERARKREEREKKRKEKELRQEAKAKAEVLNS